MTSREPLAIRASIVAVAAVLIQLAVAFGVTLTVDQVAAISAAVNVISAAVIVIWTRGAVTPVDDPRLDTEWENT